MRSIVFVLGVIGLFSGQIKAEILSTTASPLLQCQVTKKVLMGFPITMEVKVFTEHLAGHSDPTILFKVNRAFLTPNSKACEAEIDYEDHRLLLQIPLTETVKSVTGTDNGEEVTIRCVDFESRLPQLGRFMHEYASDLSACLPPTELY